MPKINLDSYKNGLNVENALTTIFGEFGAKVIPYKEYIGCNDNLNKDLVYVVLNMPIEKWHSKKNKKSNKTKTGGYTEFVILVPKYNKIDNIIDEFFPDNFYYKTNHHYPIRIDIKSQCTNGTTYQKIPYSILHFRDKSIEKNCLIVASGKEWLKEDMESFIVKCKEECKRCCENNNKHIDIINISDFLDLIINIFKQ